MNESRLGMSTGPRMPLLTLACAVVLATPALARGIEDCNGNGIPDAAEIKSRTAEDCNGNGIPDECEVAERAVPYLHDDGTLWGGLGTDISPDQTIAWMSRFTVTKGASRLNGVQIAFGVIPEGFPVTVAVWSDPNGDGNPSDAVLLASVETTVRSPWQPLTFNDIPLPEIDLGPPGTSFFVGAFMFDVPMTPAAFPAAFDCGAGCSTPDDSGQGWWIASIGSFDPNDLANSAVEFGTISQVTGGTLFADFLIRGTFCATGYCGLSADRNSNGIPDECEADCNGNGVPDDVDILFGGSPDCDGNGIPDDCEPTTDCDADGISDLCQTLGQGLVGRYFPNVNLAGPFVSRIDPQVFFDLSGFPLPPGMPNDNFSIRWSGTLEIPAEGVTELALRRDDGARLFLDGVGLIDRWTSSGGDLEVATVNLPAGSRHHLRIEYLQLGGGGLLEFMWRRGGGALEPVPPSALRPIFDADGDGRPDVCDSGDCNGNTFPDATEIALGLETDCDGNGIPDSCQLDDGDCDGDGFFDGCGSAGLSGLVGQYFRSFNPANGNPQDGRTTERVGVRLDANIDFPWGDNGPAIGGLGQSYYTVLWRGTITTPDVDGVYTFSVQHDDGVRLWIGDRRIINAWGANDTTTNATIELEGNTTYRFRMDYYNGIGGGRAILRWGVPGGSIVTIPSEAFAPLEDLDGNGAPDACDADCNGNGIVDGLELATGLALDCNGNGIPDECDVGTEPIGTDVLAYWRFEDGKSLGTDRGPNGLSATLVSASGQAETPNGTVPVTGEANGGSLRFGTGGHLRVPDPQGFVSLGSMPFTVEAWFFLDQLGSPAVAGRQWLFARKPNESGDANIDWGVLAQLGDYGTSTAVANRYGKTAGFNGREVALTFGFGSGAANQQKAVICPRELAVSETGWHYLAIAYDPFRRVVRFTLDAETEEVAVDRIWFVGNPASVPLTVGARPTTGGFDQFLRGAVDELRISGGFLSPDRLLAASYAPFSSDLDGNGVPDECIGSGCAEDLNADGVIGAPDIAILLAQWGGPGSADFDGDGSVTASDLARLLAAWGPCR